MVKLREHLFALTVHGGILIAIAILITATSCQPEEPPPAEPNPVGDFFNAMQAVMDDNAVESVTVIAVDDNSGSGEDLKRQVFQEIQARINALGTIAIIEHPTAYLQDKFTELSIIPSSGISPDLAQELAADLNADSLLYASIESDAPDVHIKLYSAGDGAVIFAETLQAWPLPVSRDDALDMFDITEDGTASDDTAGETESDLPFSEPGT